MALVSEKARADIAVFKQLNRRFGVEREAFVSDLRGNPLNVPELLSQVSFRFDGFETITREVAPNQVEMVTNPFREASKLLSSLLRLEELVLGLNGGDVRLQYLPRSKKPIGKLMGDVFATPRHKAILEALSHPDEGGRDWTHVYEMAKVCATHFHLDFRHESSQKKVNACNLLNIVAPDILAWARDEFGLPHGERSRAWARFACPERLPAPRWFRDFADYKQRFESLPRLAVGDEKDGGVWRADMEAKQVYGDPAAEGSTWWGVRLRDKYGSIEFRYLPTMPKAEQVIASAVAIDEWLERALFRIGEQVFPTLDSALAAGVVLSFKGRAVSQNEDEWRRRMNQF